MAADFYVGWADLIEEKGDVVIYVFVIVSIYFMAHRDGPFCHLFSKWNYIFSGF